MPTPATSGKPVSDVIQETVEIVDQVSEYGFLIVDSLYLIIGGMLVIFLLHKLASRFLYPRLKDTRAVKVAFGALYVLILVVAVLIVLKGLGFDVAVISKIAILVVLVGAVCIFFILPFLPRLPFKLGHMVEISGILGIVDSISTYHTTIRKFDGSMVFVPNALVMASKIINFNDVPERRIELSLSIAYGSDMDAVRAQLLDIVASDSRVLQDALAPSLFVTNADASGIKLSLYCWVKNADWLSTRSDLWLSVLKAFEDNQKMHLAKPQQDVYVKQL